jgi:glycosyltransferase involved in cell wall biosynthesis
MTNIENCHVVVTIGVCVRNCENLIREAIESIIAQDFPHKSMEVIFVDDGSSDETLSTMKSYAQKMDMSVKVFHQKWRGLGVTRNVVVNNASGEYILWVDGDMIISKDYVRKQVEFMEKNPSVGICKGIYGMHTEQSLVGTLENVEFIATNFVRKEKSNALPLGTGGAIYRVEAVRQVGGFDPCISGSGEDMDIENRIKKAGWKLSVSQAVFYERRRKAWGSLWREYFWHGQSALYIIRKNKKIISSYKFWPPFVILMELCRVIDAYQITRRKVALLLPIHYIFKRAAWLFGFLSSAVGI